MSYFDKNKFYIELATHWMPTLNKDVQRHVTKNFEPLTEPEKFILKVMQNLMGLFSHIDYLQLPVEYIQNETLPKEFDEPKMRDSYYKYHYENHVIRISSIFDYCLQFVNLLYKLGNPPKRVNAYLLFENENLSDNTRKSLKNLLKKIEHIKAERNKIIHEGNFTNEVVQDIINNNLHWDLTTMPKNDTLVEYFSNQKQGNIILLAFQMEKDIEVLTEGVSGLLDSLVDELKKTTTQLKKSRGRIKVAKGPAGRKRALSNLR